VPPRAVPRWAAALWPVAAEACGLLEAGREESGVAQHGLHHNNNNNCPYHPFLCGVARITPS